MSFTYNKDFFSKMRSCQRNSSLTDREVVKEMMGDDPLYLNIYKFVKAFGSLSKGEIEEIRVKGDTIEVIHVENSMEWTSELSIDRKE